MHFHGGVSLMTIIKAHIMLTVMNYITQVIFCKLIFIPKWKQMSAWEARRYTEQSRMVWKMVISNIKYSWFMSKTTQKHLKDPSWLSAQSYFITSSPFTSLPLKPPIVAFLEPVICGKLGFCSLPPHVRLLHSCKIVFQVLPHTGEKFAP